jgi:hypothetical protein
MNTENWNNIRIDSVDSISMTPGANKTAIGVTVINDSGETLDPGQGNGLVLSFRLLGEHNEILPYECTRTPLTAAIGPNSSHHQVISVEVPKKLFEQTSSIRVGLLQRKEYWVERHNPQHPKIIELRHGNSRSASQVAVQEAAKIWPSGQNNKLRWPYGSLMVAEKQKVLYVPIAKSACTTLKNMMIRLAEIKQVEDATRLDVHFVTDKFNTGVQLKDKPMERAREILASDDYFKFSVIREPMERVISAYLEKFVYNRSNVRNHFHIRPVIKSVRETDDIDIDAGISFDEFAAYILDQDPYELDPHWRPQHLYLRGIPNFTRIFRLDNIQSLEEYLQKELGISVELGHRNKTRKSDQHLVGVHSLVARDVEKAGPIDPDSFLDSPLMDQLKEYYREDANLYAAAD